MANSNISHSTPIVMEKQKATIAVNSGESVKVSLSLLFNKFTRDKPIAAIRNPYLNDIDFLEAIKENEEDEEISKIIENRCNKQNLKNALITFKNKFPKDTKLYKLMTTKLEEQEKNKFNEKL